MKEWYVASTHRGGEAKAQLNLKRQRFESYIPQYIRQRRHARKVENVVAPLFPGYLFIRMDLSLTAWRKINSTFGVKSLLCAGETPLPVPDDIVEEIRQKEDQNGLIALGTIKKIYKGDLVKMISGAFLDRIGVFDGMTDDQRVSVLLDVLGRQVRVRTSLSSISACT